MAEQTHIQWAHASWNPWHGCKKVSEGCKYCYMFRDKERFNKDPTQVLKSKSFYQPLYWKHPKEGSRIFTCSWSDFFIEDADEWRKEAWRVIKLLPEYDFLILTKRPENIRDRLPDDWGTGYPNVWLGTSVENTAHVDRITNLICVPAAKHFVSFEPLIGPINLENVPMNMIDWAIIGGESGNDTGKYRYRPCRLDWIKNLIADCISTDTLIFIKQMGTYLAKRQGYKDRHGGKPEEWDPALRWQSIPQRPLTIPEVESKQDQEIDFKCLCCGIAIDDDDPFLCETCYNV